MKWVLILVFYAIDTVTIIESQKVSMQTEDLCLEAKHKIIREYRQEEDLYLKASCLRTRENND